LIPKIILFRDDQGQVRKCEEGDGGTKEEDRVRRHADAEYDYEIAQVKWIPAMRKNPALHQVLGVEPAFAPAPYDILQPDGGCPEGLTRQRQDEPENCRDTKIIEDRPAWDEKQQISEWKETVSIMKQEAADDDHHLSARIPQKLYHLKNTSQCRKPARNSISLFSRSLYGIRTFSSASRFLAISISV